MPRRARGHLPRRRARRPGPRRRMAARVDAGAAGGSELRRRHDDRDHVRPGPRDGPAGDFASCCGQLRGVNEPESADPQAPADGGGRVGALVLSPRSRPARSATVALQPLRAAAHVEAAFGLKPRTRLGPDWSRSARTSSARGQTVTTGCSPRDHVSFTSGSAPVLTQCRDPGRASGLISASEDGCTELSHPAWLRDSRHWAWSWPSGSRCRAWHRLRSPVGVTSERRQDSEDYENAMDYTFACTAGSSAT